MTQIPVIYQMFNNDESAGAFDLRKLRIQDISGSLDTKQTTFLLFCQAIIG